METARLANQKEQRNMNTELFVSFLGSAVLSVVVVIAIAAIAAMG
jgi:hypothetical protein